MKRYAPNFQFSTVMYLKRKQHLCPPIIKRVSFNLVIEIISVVFSLIFLVLLMRENIWCWIFGILSSLLSIYLFIEAKLYSESILYLFYAAIGVYGWWVWSAKKDGILPVVKWHWRKSLIAFGGSALLAAVLGIYFKTYTDAESPYVDASTTAFSFLASYLEAHKVLSAWVYWIVINATSVWLYHSRGLQIYSILMVVYAALSVLGLYRWNKQFKAQVL